MQITVYITTWQVPFAHFVKAIKTCANEADAVAYINQQAQTWWYECSGERAMAEGQGEPFEPITELLHANPIELWGGEQGFVAMFDEATTWAIHNEYYERNYDAKGIERPGYLQVAEAYQSGDPQKIAKIEAKQAEVFDYYSKKGGCNA